MLTSLACFISSKVKILQFAKGYRGRAKNVLKLARLRVMKALQQMSYDRHRKHANASKIWVARINAGCREHGVSERRDVHEEKKAAATAALGVPLPRQHIIAFEIKSSRHHARRLFLRLFLALHGAAAPLPLLPLSPQVAYSRFKHAMNHQNVALNRKMLAELARHEPFSFKALVDQAVVDKVERGVTARLPHMPDPFHTVASHLELQKARQRMGRS